MLKQFNVLLLLTEKVATLIISNLRRVVVTYNKLLYKLPQDCRYYQPHDQEYQTKIH